MNISHQRLTSQHIAQHDFVQPADVVRWMGAMQAQDYLQALWAVGVRTQAATFASIEQAIAELKIIRTWPMRGTIHFVLPEDAGWMLRLCASRTITRSKRRQEQLELDSTTLDRSQKLFSETLRGGKRLSRSAMLQVLEDAGISTEGQRGYHILGYLAQLGLICIGPMENKAQTFLLLEECVTHPKRLSREDSLTELAKRYFVSHGPATVQDFAWWSGLTLTDSRAGLEGAKAALISEKIEGKDYWMSADSALSSSGEMVLLPGFDEYLLGYTDRSAVLHPQHAQKVCPGSNGIFFPVIVSGGQIVGTWKRTIKKNAVVMTHQPFSNVSKAEAFQVAAQRYGQFLGLPVVL